MSGPTSADDIKRWMLVKFRQTIRGRKVTDNIERWLHGELGKSFEFKAMEFNVMLADEALAFVRAPENRAALDAERLDDTAPPARGARGTGR